MYGLFLPVIFLSLLCTSGFATNNRENKVVVSDYALAERFSSDNISKMVFSTSITPNWFQNSDKFWYSWKTSRGTKYYIVDPSKSSKEEIFDMDKLAMKVTEITGTPYDGRHLSLDNLKLREDRFFTFTKTAPKSRIFIKGGKDEDKENTNTYKFKYDIKTKELTYTIEEQEKEFYSSFANVSPDGKYGIYVKGNDLWIMDKENLLKAEKDLKDSTIVERRITNDGTRLFSWGYDDYRGNVTGDTLERKKLSYIAWAPDSRHFATIKWDMSPVKFMWVINSLAEPRPTLETYHYQMPGEPGPKGHLYVFETETLKYRHVKTDSFKDQSMSFEYAPSKKEDAYKDYGSEIWAGDNDGFYLLRHSRDQKEYELCHVKIGADSASVVLRESMNTYIETRPVRFVDGGRKFIHWSERNGWANLYLYNSDGTLIRNLTEGSYHVENVLAINEDAGYVVFSACGVEKDENPYQMHTYKVSLNGGKIIKLDMKDMNVRAKVSDDGKYFIANYSRVDAKPAAALYDASKGKKIMDLEEADFSLLFAAGYKFPERFKVKAADGITDLYGVMYKPFDFDSTKVYPICDYVYPGPQVEANNISWSSGMTRTDRLAQIGMIVITVGNRGGHPARSKWYHNYGYGNLRDYGLEDQKYAIQQLAARHPFIDIDRVGIHGHSGGGFMSTAAILTYPDFFKVAVSCAGNHDNRIYNRWWSEQHHGIKEVLKDKDTSFVYSMKTNQELAKNLKGHLLLVHGDMDDNVHPANTIRVINALIKNNKRFDMLFLPSQRHGFGDMNEYFFWRMADYYSEWLIGNGKRNEIDIKELNNN